jgi:hypothetical protein
MGVTITPIMQEAFQRASEGSMAGWQRAQQFIVQATRKASGGANKEFQNSLAGIVQKVKSQFVDLGDAIGTALTPVFRVVAGVIGDFSAIINKVSSSLAGMFNNMGPGAQKAVTVIGMIGVAAMAIVPVFGYISAAIAPIAGLLLTILNPINLILGAVVGIGAALASAFASDKWGGQLIGVWNKIVSVGQSLWDTIAGLGSVIMVRVQPAWEALQATAARIFTAIGTFISDNEATWNEWATYVGEIVGGFIGTTLELWNGFVNFVVNAWNWISNVTGITWDGIKNVVTKTLRAISLIFSNFSLSVQIAWTAIQLGAQVAFDYLGDVFWEWYGVASGSISAVGATFSTLWNNVLAGLQYMFNRVKATFTAIYEASAALFRGRNPVTAFRASYERELRRMESTSRSYKDVGEAAADAYKRGYDSVLAANPPGESEKQKRLREQLGDQLGALDAGQAEKRRLAKEQGKTSISGKGSSDSATAEVNMTASPNGMPNMVKIQFESVGLTDMWKKVQERLTGGSMLGLTQQTAQATKETSVQAREQTAVLKRIEEKLVKAPAAVAGP